MGKHHHKKKRGAESGSGEPPAKKARLTAAEATAAGYGVRGDYVMTKPESAIFRAFYEAQHLFASQAEFEQFYCALQSTLPAWFRLTGSRDTAHVLKTQLQKLLFDSLNGISVHGVPLLLPTAVPWYPDGLAYRVDLPRAVIREEPACKRFHNFLVSESEQGNISRQEVVSMIPPLLMNIESHHKVLDMCAAPGSKTAQLIEMLHANGETMPTGFVLANDSDARRAYLLTHQTKRLQSPSFMVLNTDAAQFPAIRLPTGPDGSLVPILFDRILCDVPCSGDGTLRKNPMLWKTWTPALGLGLHKLQARILKRGLELLAVGGRLVYSTCSFNPIENEAVVAELLRLYPDCVELQNVTAELPTLLRAPGLSSWVVMDKVLGTVTSHDQVPEPQRKRLTRSMFPPTVAESAAMHLDRCLRLYPQHQDTGGFFVSVLVKTAPLSYSESLRQTRGWVNPIEGSVSAEASADVVGATDALAGVDASTATADVVLGDNDIEEGMDGCADESKTNAKEDARRVYKEAPFIFAADHLDFLKTLKEFYGATDAFPTRQVGRVLSRSVDAANRNLYLVSSNVRDILVHNDLSRLRVVNTGVRIFTRAMSHDPTSGYRLCQDGIDVTFPFLSARCVLIAEADMLEVARTDSTPINKLSELAQEGVRVQTVGVCVLFTDGSAEGSVGCPLRLVVWRGEHVLRLLVSTGDRSHTRLILGDASALDVRAKVGGQKQPKAAAVGESGIDGNGIETTSGEIEAPLDGDTDVDGARPVAEELLDL